MHESVVSELYKPQLKKYGDYPPTLKVKFPMKNGSFVGEIYNEKNETISMNEIKKGSEVQAIIENNGVYFVAKDFGVSWKVIQLKVFPSEKLTGYSFIDE